MRHVIQVLVVLACIGCSDSTAPAGGIPLPSSCTNPSATTSCWTWTGSRLPVGVIGASFTIRPADGHLTGDWIGVPGGCSSGSCQVTGIVNGGTLFSVDSASFSLSATSSDFSIQFDGHIAGGSMVGLGSVFRAGVRSSAQSMTFTRK